MVAKQATRALALLLALPSAAFALGLGDIHLLTSLNAPLDAEIELTDVAPDEINTVQAQLASRDTFAKNGLEWAPFLSGVTVKTVRTSDGRALIKLKTTDPVSDPFLTLLVEVNWSRGHLVREYTVLFDPPVFTPGQSAAANAPVTAPSTGAGAHEGSIARAPAPAAPTPPSAAEPPAAPAPTASSEAASAASASAPSGGEEGAASTRVVHRGDTLSHIAASVAGADATTPKARSWMLAIFQANPHAFDKNMNVLHSGAVLRIPDAATAASVSPSEASAEIRRQFAAWRNSTGAPAESAASTPSQQPGRLKLVTPSQGASAGITPGSPGSEVSALQGRVHDLESQLAESKRLLELKNADLARVQAQLAAKQAAQPGTPATPQPTQPPVAQASPPPAAQTPPATEATPPAPEEKPAAPPPAAEAVPPPPAPQHQVVPSGGSIFDTLKGYWWVLLLLIAAVAVVAISRVLRSRRASEFDDSLGRLAVAGAGGDGGVSGGGARGLGRSFAAEDASPARAAGPRQAPATHAPDAAFLVEESGSHERPRMPTGAPAAAPTPRHVASDETISSETAINLDQGDPLAEADFHMAYGLYDQAADLIRIAISREPERRDLKLKLLEVFFVWGNKEQFLQTARELAGTRAEAAPGEWEKILIMGKQLAPDDALFSSGAAVTGAAAGGVDLDLEGGQSRVDFDLLGEPVAADAPQGVDLDLGGATGETDATTSESLSNVTDRNAALLENSFTGATTGTTRQMTARVRQDGGPTGEFEGPTVEQPTLHGQEQHPTVRQKVETALRSGSPEQTAELAIDDLDLDVDTGAVDTVDQLGPASAARSTPDGPTLVAGLDERSRKTLENTQRISSGEEPSTGAWSFDQDELEAALTQTSLAVPDPSATSRLAALKGHSLDVDFGDATASHAITGNAGVDLDVGSATGVHAAANGGLDLDVGTANVPDTAFAATQKLSSEDLALPDLEPVTMSEVGTKLDLARAYMDMGDPDGARNILEEVLNEGSAAQKQEAKRLMESLPG